MEPVQKKVKLSPGSLEMYEQEAINLHNIAMGYAPRPEPDGTTNILELAMQQFPVPPALHDTFQSWIRRNQLARFDCFLEPSIECECYKCQTVLAKKNSDLTYFEARLDSNERRAIESMDVLLPSHPLLELPQISFPSSEPANAVPLDVSVHNIAHYYVDIPVTFGVAPSTPKLTTLDVSSVASDQGKQEAQQKWIRLMNITPTFLRF